MIRRGTSHMIYTKTEIMQRLKNPETAELLEKMMWYYECWSRLNMFREQKITVAMDQTKEFKELMSATKKWLAQPDADDADEEEGVGLFPHRGSSRKKLRVKLKEK